MISDEDLTLEDLLGDEETFRRHEATLERLCATHSWGVLMPGLTDAVLGGRVRYAIDFDFDAELLAEDEPIAGAATLHLVGSVSLLWLSAGFLVARLVRGQQWQQFRRRRLHL